MTQSTLTSGHRSRLRRRFLARTSTLSDTELLELLLPLAIPRQDVAPQSSALLNQLGGPPGVLAAPIEELLGTPGSGRQAALLMNAVSGLAERGHDETHGTPG